MGISHTEKDCARRGGAIWAAQCSNDVEMTKVSHYSGPVTGNRWTIEWTVKHCFHGLTCCWFCCWLGKYYNIKLKNIQGINALGILTFNRHLLKIWILIVFSCWQRKNIVKIIILMYYSNCSHDIYKYIHIYIHIYIYIYITYVYIYYIDRKSVV